MLVGAGLDARLAAGPSTPSGPAPPGGCATTRGGCSACRRDTRRRRPGRHRRRCPGAAGRTPGAAGRWSAYLLHGGPRRAHRAARRPGRRRAAGRAVADPAAAVVAAVESGEVLEHEPPEPEDPTSARAGPGAGTPLARTAGRGRGRARASPGCSRPPSGSPTASVRRSAKGLDETQQGAVARCCGDGVSVLTGGPGTGKSRTVAAMVALAARPRASRSRWPRRPAGRPSGWRSWPTQPAVDLHRLLGAQGTRPAAFARGEEWPLDAELVVVDEASMLDVELAAALLEACADGTHLVLVGDPAQLPSIGPGRVLGDLIDSGARAGDRADHAVPAGRGRRDRPAGHRGPRRRAAAGRRPGPRGGRSCPARGSAEAAHRVVQLVTDSIPRALRHRPATVQVVTPVHRGPAGTQALNRALKAELNPGTGTVCGFDAGDRVVATANHLDAEPTGYANGEVGVVTGDRRAAR